MASRLIRNLIRYRPWLVPWRMMAYGRRLKRTMPDWAEVRARSGGQPEQDTVVPSRVLIATSTGGHLTAATMDSLLASALARRGAAVQVLLCDAALPVCMLAEKHILPVEERLLAEGPLPMCQHCAPAGDRLFAEAGIRIRRFSEFLTVSDRVEAARIALESTEPELKSLLFNGIAVGEQAFAGTLRYYAVGDLDREPNGTRLLRRYVEAAILTAIASGRLLEEGFDAVVLHHAIYVPQGVIAATAKASGARVVAWNTAYRTGCFIFSHDRTYHFTLIEDGDLSWIDAPFGPAEREQTRSYLESRRGGSKDWISYQKSEKSVAVSEIGLDPDKPLISLMTNIIWDAQLYYTSNAFSTMKDWVLDTIRWFSERPNLQLLVRIHPAEIYNPLAARQLMLDEINAAFPALPANVKVVPPDNPLNSYALADLSDTILIFGTKMGVELAAAGKPVIVAGEAWIRNKGIAHEASSSAEYHALLERLPLGPTHDPEMTERALRYAHHFFFRCMIPVSSTRARAGWPPFELSVERLDDLDPGRDPGLDIICEGILQGTPFLWPAGADSASAADGVSGAGGEWPPEANADLPPTAIGEGPRVGAGP